MTTNTYSFRARCLSALVASMAFVCASPAAISLGENSRVQVGGFFSQGYLKSDGNNFPAEDRDGTFDFREMGINASGSVTPHLRVGAQLFAQRLGNYGEDKVLLDWAVADYNFNQQFGVRVGRIKYPKGLYGEALDLDVVRPFIFLPNALYNPVLRDFNSSFNGAMAYGTLDGGKSAGSVDYKVFYGDMPMNQSQGVADFLLTGGSYKLPQGVSQMGIDHVMGGALDWSTPVSGLKAHVSFSRLADFFGRGTFAYAPVPISIDLPKIDYTTVGVEYVWQEWTFATEWQGQKGTTHVLAAPVLNSDGVFGSRGYYVAASRRIGSKWQVGAYYSDLTNRYPTAGARSSDKHMADTALCVRFDVSEHVIFKIEGHRAEGTYNTFNTPRTANPPASVKDTTNYFAAKTTLFF